MNTYISEEVLYLAKQYNLLFNKEMNASNLLKNSINNDSFIELVNFEFPLLSSIKFGSNGENITLREYLKIPLLESSKLNVVFDMELDEKIQKYLDSYIQKFKGNKLETDGKQYLQYEQQKNYLFNELNIGELFSQFGKKLNLTFNFDEFYSHKDSFLPLHILLSLEKDNLITIGSLSDLTIFGERNNSIRVIIISSDNFYKSHILNGTKKEFDVVPFKVTKKDDGYYFTIGDGTPLFFGKKERGEIKILKQFINSKIEKTKEELGYEKQQFQDSFYAAKRRINNGIREDDKGIKSIGYEFESKRISGKTTYIINKKGQ